MTHHVCHPLTFSRRVLLGAATLVAVTGPVFIGALELPAGQAQSTSEPPLSFEVASVKPSSRNARGTRLNITPVGGLNCSNLHLKQLLEFAYDVQGFQITGAPGWLESEGFDILAKPPATTEAAPDIRYLTDEQRKGRENRIRRRTQSLLAERFGLVIHKAEKEMPAYALVVAKGGPKLKEVNSTEGPMHIQGDRGSLIARGAPLELFANVLARRTGRPVADKTGLAGRYDFTLTWAESESSLGAKSDDSAASEPETSLFTALQEQLGLKLETQRMPVGIIVIDHIERPSAN